MDPALVAQTGMDLVAFKHYYHAATTLLIYDYILTFADEVELIWKRKKIAISYLFLFLRYFTLASCAVIYFGHEMPSWGLVQSTTFVEVIAQVVMILRVHALAQNKPIVFGLSALAVVQFGVGLYLSVASHHAIELPMVPLEMFYSCFLDPFPLKVKLAYIFLLVAFDSITFLLTLYYTVVEYRPIAKHGTIGVKRLLSSILENAVIYFGILAACHSVLVAGALTWRPTLKLLPACPTVLFTSILINRVNMSTLKAGQADSNILSPQRPPLPATSGGNLGKSDLLPDGVEFNVDVTSGGVAPTLLSSIHIYT